MKQGLKRLLHFRLALVHLCLKLVEPDVYVTDESKLTDTVEDVVGDSGDDAVNKLDVVSVHNNSP